MPRAAQVNPTHHHILVGAAVRLGAYVIEPDPEGLPALLTSMRVQHDVPGDSKRPCSGIVVILRHLGKATPDNEERICDHVFRHIFVCAPLNEPEEVRVRRFV